MHWYGSFAVLICLLAYHVVGELVTRREEARWRDAAIDSSESTVAKTRRQLDTTAPTSGAPISGPWKGWREMVVRSIRDESPDCRSFTLAPVDLGSLPPFHGGQFLMLRCQDPVTGKKLSRCYSLSSSPGEDTYRITVKRVRGGAMSNLLHDHVRINDVLDVQTPKGSFHLKEESNGRPVHLVAAGIGITPMISMLMERLEAGVRHPIHLHYQLRDSHNAPFLKLLRQTVSALPSEIPVRLHVWLSRPGATCQHDGDRVGRLDAERILAQAESVDGSFMICGPSSFMSGIAEGLVASGVADGDVHYESFGGKSTGVGAIAVEQRPHDDEPDSSKGFRIQFAASSKSATWNAGSGSLLDLAENHGLELESSCRSGDCGMCIQRIRCGRVRYAQPPSCEMEQGDVVMCVAEPAEDVTLEV
ncbi:MAG: FAD-binding oxidoreductase [Planctomycetota bacterium]